MKPWHRILFRVDDAVFVCEQWLLAIAHASIVLFIVAGVGFRYLLNNPMVWGEELMVGLFVWLVFVGASAAVRTSSHIRLDVLGSLSRHAGFRWMAPITLLIALVILVTLLGTSMEYLSYELMAYSPTLDISRGWFVAAMPVGFLGMTLHLIRRWVEQGADNVFRSEADLALEAVNAHGDKS